VRLRVDPSKSPSHLERTFRGDKALELVSIDVTFGLTSGFVGSAISVRVIVDLN
jgi:hypothetical protein